MNREDSQHEQQLDDLLDAARWPEGDETQVQRLEAFWENTLEKESDAIGKPIGHEYRKPGISKWLLAAAATLLLGSVVGLVWQSSKSETGNDRLVREPKPRSDENRLADKDHPVPVDNVLPITDSPQPTAVKRKTRLSQDQYLGFLAKARNQKTQSRIPESTLVRSVSTHLGRSTLLAAATQTLIRDMDAHVAGQKASRQISGRQWNQYRRWRKSWEDWAWQFVDSRKSTHQLASIRFAIAISTRDSMPRLHNMLEIQSVAGHATVAISRLGNSFDIDRALERVNSPRSKKTLLLALLDQPGPQPALMFLKYLQNPVTAQVAAEIANSTDQLPTHVWLTTIANRDQSRWDAALAVSHVCDQRVVNGLIRLATDPATSKPAMIALIRSSCTDAQNFVAFAETNQLLSGQLAMARRKLRELEEQSTGQELRNETRGL